MHAAEQDLGNLDWTLAHVAAELGEDEDWLFDIIGEMEPEDGVIWV